MNDGSEPYGRYRQAELYAAGRAGMEPTVPVGYGALRDAAEEAMSPEAAAYVSGDAGEERTTRDNRRAFDRWWLRPRLLRDVERRDLRVELFGETLDAPVLLAPVGAQGILHDDGEVATARTAASVGVPMVASSVASETLEAGADGVVVSNHGGRQVDGAIPALAALPDVTDAVGDDVPVLFDSGIQGGADAVTALALGAEAVLLGRPHLYGLALAGTDGVEAVLKNLLANLDLTLGLTGHDAVTALDRDCLVENPEFG